MDWVIQLESNLNEIGIEFSQYDEFYINQAILFIEGIVKEQNFDNHASITETLLDEYLQNALHLHAHDQKMINYYTTLSEYLRRRFTPKRLESHKRNRKRR